MRSKLSWKSNWPRKPSLWISSPSHQSKWFPRYQWKQTRHYSTKICISIRSCRSLSIHEMISPNVANHTWMNHSEYLCIQKNDLELLLFLKVWNPNNSWSQKYRLHHELHPWWCNPTTPKKSNRHQPQPIKNLISVKLSPTSRNL